MQENISNSIVYNDGELELNVSLENETIISIGYRVNSITAIKFRQLETSVLKNYIQNGYIKGNIS